MCAINEAQNLLLYKNIGLFRLQNKLISCLKSFLTLRMFICRSFLVTLPPNMGYYTPTDGATIAQISVA